MTIKLPHLFKKHDTTFNINVSKQAFMITPWYRRFLCEDIRIEYGDEVYDNYAGWLWFVVNWYSTK
jgi:hypothetical protein